MKKHHPQFLIFFSLIFLFSCTITKRKYTSGYSINWHSKVPNTKLIAQAKTIQPTPIKIAQSNTASEKIDVAPKTEKTFIQKIVKAIASAHKEIETHKNISNNLTPTLVSSYSVPPESTVPGHDTNKKRDSTTALTLGIIFCLVGFISGFFC